MAQWTVNPYVASSSLARGASFLDVFAHTYHVQFSNVAKTLLTFSKFATVACALSSAVWIYL